MGLENSLTLVVTTFSTDLISPSEGRTTRVLSLNTLDQQIFAHRGGEEREKDDEVGTFYTDDYESGRRYELSRTPEGSLVVRRAYRTSYHSVNLENINI